MQINILESMSPRELGAELKKARDKRGLTQKEAAEVIDVARTTITAIEKGERRVKASELIKLARAYGYQIGDFVRQERPKSTDFQPQFRAAYRHREEAIADDCIFELEELARNYVELERITDNPLIYNYPDETQYQVIGSRIEPIAENVAYLERRRLGLGDGPVPILRNILEHEVGLRIFYLKIKPSSYSAMYVYDPVLGGCIAVNRSHPVERRRWSLAHEYAHFLVHRQRADLLDEQYQRLPERERFADAFARHFLMPTAGLMKQIGTREVRRVDLFILANYFGASVEALTRRLEDLQIIPSGTWDEMRSRDLRVRDVQAQLNLAAIPDQDAKLPIRYQYLAVEALDRELISEGKFTKFLGVSRVEARSIISALKSTDGELDLNPLIGDIKRR